MHKLIFGIFFFFPFYAFALFLLYSGVYKEYVHVQYTILFIFCSLVQQLYLKLEIRVPSSGTYLVKPGNCHEI